VVNGADTTEMNDQPNGLGRTDLADAARLEAALVDREERLRSIERRLASTLTELATYQRVVGRRGLGRRMRARAVAAKVVARAAPASSMRGLGLRHVRNLARVLSSDGVGAAVQRLRARRARLNPAVASPPTAEDTQYRRWLLAHDPTPHQLREMRRDNATWTYRPLISIVVPVYNPDRLWLVAMFDSVSSQAYDNWELCLADDHSPSPEVRATLTQWATGDARIKLTFREENGNIAAASNTALALASGEFVALLDNDDVLRPHALHRIVQILQDEPEVDLVFSDEDKILIGGDRGQVHFKAEFDPDYLLSTNYLSHLSVLRRDTVNAVGGFRSGLDGSQDHDLVLRVSEIARRVRHVPDVLYSWRQVPGSAALVYSEKPAAWEAGRRAVADALERRGQGARADFGPTPGLYVVRYPLRPLARVTAIVSASDAAITARVLAALRRSPGMAPARWIICGYDPALEQLRERGIDAVVAQGSAHHARLLNNLVANDDSDVLVFLGSDLAPEAGTSWLEPMLEQALRSAVGAVGGQVLDNRGTAESAGIRVGGPGAVEAVGLRLPVIQRVSAVSVDCMAIQRRVFDALGGFDRRYRVSMHDVDLCLRLRRAGLATIYTPLTQLKRLTPRVSAIGAADDAEEFRRVWEGSPEWTDPFVSPWLESVSPLTIRDA
jgi:GT2 family glycosyltransferase